MSEYTLYCFAQSGNCYKAALMLSLCGAEWKPRFVDFFNGETRTPEYRELNEMGEAPVLLHGDLTLTQSGVILDYLAGELHQFQPRDSAQRREVWRWILYDNHRLTHSTATLRFLLNFAKTGETPVTEFLRGRMLSAFAVLDKHLGGRRFVAGDNPTIADLSICGYLYFPDEIDVSWSDYPAVGEWLERIQSLPGWAHPYDLMPGHPLPGDE